jgi:hypothetical protein
VLTPNPLPKFPGPLLLYFLPTSFLSLEAKTFPDPLPIILTAFPSILLSLSCMFFLAGPFLCPYFPGAASILSS